MARKANTNKPMILCFAWIALTGALMLPAGVAAQSGTAGTAIRDITPMTEIGAHRINVQPENYFDVIGLLNVLENDRIVVGNSRLKPASGLNTSHVALSNVVGVKVNKAGEVVKIEVIHDEPH